MVVEHLFVKIFLCHLAFSTAESWRPYVFEFTNISTYSLSPIVAINSSLTANGSITAFLTTFEQIQNFYGKVLFALKSESGLYDMEVIDRTINFCELFKNKRHERIVQLFYTQFIKHGDVPSSCPIPRKLYYLKNAVIDTETLPPVFPIKKAMVDITVLVKNGNKTKPLFRYVIHFEVRQNNKS